MEGLQETGEQEVVQEVRIQWWSNIKEVVGCGEKEGQSGVMVRKRFVHR